VSERFLPRTVFLGINRNKLNPNWQDKLLGGAILTGIVEVAAIAGLFALVTWNHNRRTADHLPALTTQGLNTSAN
jgi:hypothetical protein